MKTAEDVVIAIFWIDGGCPDMEDVPRMAALVEAYADAKVKAALAKVPKRARVDKKGTAKGKTRLLTKGKPDAHGWVQAGSADTYEGEDGARTDLGEDRIKVAIP